MDQVPVNLDVNARNAMPRGGISAFETGNLSPDEIPDPGICGFRKGKFVMLRIKDTGSGMERETMAYIFDPFYTTRKFGRGTGLKLSTVFGIFQQYSGRITCQSKPGKGTCFIICLTAADENIKPD